jgi:formylglycine-generating enzyme required for sulfatase activity
MGRRASSAASHGHTLLLQINDQQSKEFYQNQDQKDIGRDRVKLRLIELRGEDLLELQRHDPALCLERVVPPAVPGALLSPPQTCRTGTAPAWRHAMTPRPERDQLFISYSHVDRGWVERLQTMIRPLVRSEALRLWDDSQIPPGAKWKVEIEKALASAKVALLLVSDDFLASEFVTNQELPPLLRAAEEEGLCILWVCLGPCFYEATPIDEYQAVLPPGEPLEALSPVQQKAALKTIAGAIRDALRSEVAAAQVPPAPVPPAPVQPRSVPAPLSAPPASTAAPAATDSSRLQHFATSTCLLRQEGGRWSMERRPLQVEGYREDLGEGVALTMVTIPAGSFLMGSPMDEPERVEHEGPQHEVTLGSFFMAQTPITQAQWRAVAGWQKLERDLKPDPSKFKGANRPVEQVSWLDALEFCRRLNQRTGQRYGLPSEAQWEYACRAGSTTPFHFGATLTPELANYNGNDAYGNGSKGTYREQTIEVASFPSNGWGLHDMHGNVWEWCADHWHDSYNFAPGDDQPWLIPAAADDEPRLLRGGSWYSCPRYCRSASRYHLRPGFAYYHVGFRVVCLPQGPSLNP